MKKLNMKIPPNIKIYKVGGAVRDSLLGLEVVETDWVVVGATPEWMIEQGFKQVGRDFPVFLHPVTHDQYALARTEKKTGRGYHQFNFHTSPEVTLEQDLLRRDLTINAMAMDDDGTIIDPYNGQGDLANKVIRQVSAAFVEDPLRVLRVARFYARFVALGFDIEQSTLQTMRQIVDSGELLYLSEERIWSENIRALAGEQPWHYFVALKNCGALTHVMPSMIFCFEQAMGLIYEAKSYSVDAYQLYSLLLALFFIDQTNLLDAHCNQRKLPNKIFKTSAKIIHAFPFFLQINMQKKNTKKWAQAVLQFYQLIDGWRQTSEVETILFLSSLLMQSVYPEDDDEPPLDVKRIIQNFNQAIDSISDINVQTFVKRGLKGKAIATALNEERLLRLEQWKLNLR